MPDGLDGPHDSLTHEGRVITFSSRLRKKQRKGLSLQTTSARVTFDLLVDGERVRRYILIGKTGLYPDSVPFALMP